MDSKLVIDFIILFLQKHNITITALITTYQALLEGPHNSIFIGIQRHYRPCQGRKCRFNLAKDKEFKNLKMYSDHTKNKLHLLIQYLLWGR